MRSPVIPRRGTGCTGLCGICGGAESSEIIVKIFSDEGAMVAVVEVVAEVEVAVLRGLDSWES